MIVLVTTASSNSNDIGNTVVGCGKVAAASNDISNIKCNHNGKCLKKQQPTSSDYGKSSGIGKIVMQ